MFHFTGDVRYFYPHQLTFSQTYIVSFSFSCAYETWHSLTNSLSLSHTHIQALPLCLKHELYHAHALSLSLSLSLSHTHTHSHSHTLSPTKSFSVAKILTLTTIRRNSLMAGGFKIEIIEIRSFVFLRPRRRRRWRSNEGRKECHKIRDSTFLGRNSSRFTFLPVKKFETVFANSVARARYLLQQHFFRFSQFSLLFKNRLVPNFLLRRCRCRRRCRRRCFETQNLKRINLFFFNQNQFSWRCIGVRCFRTSRSEHQKSM